MSDEFCVGCEIELSDKNGSLMDGRLRGTPHTCGKNPESTSVEPQVEPSENQTNLDSEVAPISDSLCESGATVYEGRNQSRVDNDRVAAMNSTDGKEQTESIVVSVLQSEVEQYAAEVASLGWSLG